MSQKFMKFAIKISLAEFESRTYNVMITDLFGIRSVVDEFPLHFFSDVFQTTFRPTVLFEHVR